MALALITYIANQHYYDGAKPTLHAYWQYTALCTRLISMPGITSLKWETPIENEYFSIFKT